MGSDDGSGFKVISFARVAIFKNYDLTSQSFFSVLEVILQNKILDRGGC